MNILTLGAKYLGALKTDKYGFHFIVFINGCVGMYPVLFSQTFLFFTILIIFGVEQVNGRLPPAQGREKGSSRHEIVHLGYPHRDLTLCNTGGGRAGNVCVRQPLHGYQSLSPAQAAADDSDSIGDAHIHVIAGYLDAERRNRAGLCCPGLYPGSLLDRWTIADGVYLDFYGYPDHYGYPH